MVIVHLSLTNFRNYASLELDLPHHLVIIQGDNAQGKTNLLEAIYLLATARSPRSNAERELISWLGQGERPPVARLFAEVQKAREKIRVEIALRGQGELLAGSEIASVQKRIRVNGIVRRAIDLIGQVNVVMFGSQDIELIGGVPALRRRYLDIAISQVDSRYLRSLQHYNKVLLQRNHLLRLILDHQAEPDQLSFWDRELIENGSYLTVHRRRIVAALSNLAQSIHWQLSGGQERLELVYLPSLGREVLGSECQAQAVEQVFRKALHDSQKKELALGMTVVGPHRDDVQFLVNNRDMCAYGSRGQQRSIAIALKLAEAKFMLAELGDSPVLLLDDVLSELDPLRRHHLLESVDEYQQVLITTTDLDRFEPDFLAQVAQFQVRQGMIHPLY